MYLVNQSYSYIFEQTLKANFSESSYYTEQKMNHINVFHQWPFEEVEATWSKHEILGLKKKEKYCLFTAISNPSLKTFLFYLFF